MKSTVLSLIASAVIIISCSKNNVSNNKALIIGSWKPVNQVSGIADNSSSTEKDTLTYLTPSGVAPPFMNFQENGIVSTLIYLPVPAGGGYGSWYTLYDTSNYIISGNNLFTIKNPFEANSTIQVNSNVQDTFIIQTLTIDSLILYEKYTSITYGFGGSFDTSRVESWYTLIK